MKSSTNRKLSDSAKPLTAVNLEVGASVDSMLKLRVLLEELTQEVNSLDERSLSFLQSSLWDQRDTIDFYKEVERFEKALIRSALRRTAGHQIHAARLMNKNPTTLNAKIKQYQIR